MLKVYKFSYCVPKALKKHSTSTGRINQYTFGVCTPTTISFDNSYSYNQTPTSSFCKEIVQ